MIFKKTLCGLSASLLALTSFASLAVGNDSTTTSSMNTTDTQSMNADNSGKNVRDRHEGAKTADSQMKSTDMDVEVTRQIRQAIMDQDSLSMAAKNVKIITHRGQVTLRGPVNSAMERDTIGSLAQKISGVKSVRNNLEVKSSE